MERGRRVRAGCRSAHDDPSLGAHCVELPASRSLRPHRPRPRAPPPVTSLTSATTSAVAWLTVVGAEPSARASFSSPRRGDDHVRPERWASDRGRRHTATDAPHEHPLTGPRRRARVTSMRYAVSNTSGNAAASSNERSPGIANRGRGHGDQLGVSAVARLADDVHLPVLHDPRVEHDPLVRPGQHPGSVGAEDPRLRAQTAVLANPDVEMVERRRAQLDQDVALAGRRDRGRPRSGGRLGAAVLVDAESPSRRHNPRMTGEDVRRLGEELGLDALGVARAGRPIRRPSGSSWRAARSAGLFAEMKFTMAHPEVSCHPEALVPGARTVISAALCYWRPRGAARRRARAGWPALHVGTTPATSCARSSMRAGRAPWRDVPRARRREPARRPAEGRGTQRGGLLRQEHAADHAARHGSWVVLGTLVTDVEPRARPSPLDTDCGDCRHLHRRLPDRRPRRARNTGRHSLPVVLDAGAALRAGRVSARAGSAGLRLRHLPGRLPLEPRSREAPMAHLAARPAPAYVDLRALARRRRPTELVERAYDRLYVPRNDPRWLSPCNARSSRSATWAMRATSRCSSASLRTATSLIAEHVAWALGRSARRRA